MLAVSTQRRNAFLVLFVLVLSADAIKDTGI